MLVEEVEPPVVVRRRVVEVEVLLHEARELAELVERRAKAVGERGVAGPPPVDVDRVAAKRRISFDGDTISPSPKSPTLWLHYAIMSPKALFLYQRL